MLTHPDFRPARFLSVCLFAVLFNGTTYAQESSLVERFSIDGLPFVTRHCVACHGLTEPQADVNLAVDQTSASVNTHRATWERVLEVVANGQMPPSDKPRPAQDEIDKFVSVVNAIFDDADSRSPLDPGKVTVRRLNRTEYNNTVRDLMLIDFDPAEDFPSDDIGHGFDNIGDVLTMSPILKERYLAAAESIVQKAILVGDPPPPPERRDVATFLKTTRKEAFEIPFRTLDEIGTLSTSHKLKVEGEYTFRFRAWSRHVGDEPARLEVLIDDRVIDTIEVTGTDKDKKVYSVKPVRLDVGKHKISVKFINPWDDPDLEKPEDRTRAVFVEYFEFVGPLDMVPLSHRTLLACRADSSQIERTREVLVRFLSRAYRRSVREDELQRMTNLVSQCLSQGLSWEAAMQRAFLATLVSPKFLFRLELDDRPEGPEPRQIDGFHLASRLSYFLWSSMPDDELLTLAQKGELTANLDSQVHRMLANPKSSALVQNFAMQWLQLKRLKLASPDSKQFPEFTETLRSAMLTETELFIEAIIREDRPLDELIDANFVFVNEPLAQLYGLEDRVKQLGKQKQKSGPNQDFVRITLPDKQRGGLLTQASVLTVTSNPTRTSPVKRGRWILEQILGEPPPPPPPNVPELVEGEKAQLMGTLRQRMEQHRANPACANCHTTMDALGFAFENFNAIGRFRDKDGDFPIEAAGSLPNGKSFQGPSELKTILIEQRSRIARNLIRKLMTYAIGRGLEPYDRQSIAKIQTALDKDGYKFSILTREIVKSAPFRLRRGTQEKVASSGPQN